MPDEKNRRLYRVIVIFTTTFTNLFSFLKYVYIFVCISIHASRKAEKLRWVWAEMEKDSIFDSKKESFCEIEQE